jgi:high-affinity Fe2+/Pb2+ permease
VGSLVNMVLGAGVAVAIVLGFWLVAGFIDAQHR